MIGHPYVPQFELLNKERFIPRADGEYKCLFGTDAIGVNAHYVNESHITCLCPEGALGTVEFNVALAGKDYFPNSLSFIYYGP